MRARVGFVTTPAGGDWSEPDLVVRRVSGALACWADVDLLVAGPAPGRAHRGAVGVTTFQAARGDPSRLAALRTALFGPPPSMRPVACECVQRAQRLLARCLPWSAQDALLRGVGGFAPDLFCHLQAARYDVVVFAGCDNASSYWGMEALGDRCPCVVLPLAVADVALWSPAVAEVLDRADRLVVTSPVEGRLLQQLVAGLKPDRWRDVGFAVRVNAMAARAPAFGFDGRPTVVLARDWTLTPPDPQVIDWCAGLEDDSGRQVAVRMAGPGTQRLPRRFRAEATSSRTDVWRWVSHALAVLDPEPNRLLGREVLESLQFSTPVIVAADGGASRLHAEAGSCGLWYRDYRELRHCVEALLDRETRAGLGRQGAAYALGYSDSTAFVQRVADAVLGLL